MTTDRNRPPSFVSNVKMLSWCALIGAQNLSWFVPLMPYPTALQKSFKQMHADTASGSVQKSTYTTKSRSRRLCTEPRRAPLHRNRHPANRHRVLRALPHPAAQQVHALRKDFHGAVPPIRLARSIRCLFAESPVDSRFHVPPRAAFLVLLRAAARARVVAHGMHRGCDHVGRNVKANNNTKTNVVRKVL